jgi:hypothetical protein
LCQTCVEIETEINLIILQLNEINFELLKGYNDLDENFPRMKAVLDYGFQTTSEENYSDLEPWIQWPSFYTGKTLKEHQIYRLGDASHSGEEQFFEVLERNGFSIGCISPMNASNNLKSSPYFIPDPWIDTPVSGGRLIQYFYSAVKQSVNDNSNGRISLKSKLTILFTILRFVDLKYQKKLLSYYRNIGGKSYRKALFLDQLLVFIHLSLQKKYTTDLSSIFLNSFAHIQHHYFFNSKAFVQRNSNPDWYIAPELDPVREAMFVYEDILSEYDRHNEDYLLLTGLSQNPYNKTKFYYRLHNPTLTLKKLGIDDVLVKQRMTRDFEIFFKDGSQIDNCLAILKSCNISGELAFGDFERRSSSLFVSFSYPDEISQNSTIVAEQVTIPVFDEVDFVAIKNGSHSPIGYGLYKNKGSYVSTADMPIWNAARQILFPHFKIHPPSSFGSK